MKVRLRPTRVVIRVRIAMVKSWNIISCSIAGEALSWNDMRDQVEIAKRAGPCAGFKPAAFICHSGKRLKEGGH